MAANDKRRYALEVVQWRQRQHQEHGERQEFKDAHPNPESDRSDTNESVEDVTESDVPQPALYLPNLPSQNQAGALPSHGDQFPQFARMAMGNTASSGEPSNNLEHASPTRQMQLSAIGQQPGFGSLAWVAQELGEDGVLLFVHLFRNG